MFYLWQTNRKSFIVAMMLMPIALIGLILIQFFLVKGAVDDRQEAFAYSVGEALGSTSETIGLRELNKYITRFVELKEKDSLGRGQKSELRNLLFIQENKNTRETFMYNHGVLEQNYKLPSKLFNLPGNDSTSIRNYVSKQLSRTTPSSKILDGQVDFKTLDLEQSKRFNSFDRAMFEELFKEISEKLSIHQRIDTAIINDVLSKELTKRGLNLPFKYAVFDRALEQVTNIKSEGFVANKGEMYSVPIFRNSNGVSHYVLMVYFPSQDRFLLYRIGLLAVLSVLFTGMIIWVFLKTLLQLKTQRKISEIKTDFINNMTHEFKTPIATINLALDALKKNEVLQNEEKMNFYLKMLRDENKRMHAHVENVLQISKLEKNQLQLEKEPLDAHDIIETAVAHISLLLQERGGEIKEELHAENTDILANELHFTNVIVNILENAIKYSPQKPQIKICTEVVNNKLVIRINDKGIGMHKSVLKHIFDKFYRVPTGDLHNVKGHGLGLAYVKQIINEHGGAITAESEEGSGSTFIIKIPLI